MENEELLAKIQALADETAKHFVRPAKLDLIHRIPQEDGSEKVLVLGSDMPTLVYRVFNVSADGKTIEETKDIRDATAQTQRYNTQIKPTLKLVPPAVEELHEYEIMIENKLDNGGVEVKLRSSTGRMLTMIEVYRYFDYVTKIFFVCCIGTSFGGQYLFSVTPDSKHLRLLLTNDETIRKRVNMITELLQNRLLPSYQTIDAASQLLSGKAKAHLSMKNAEGVETTFNATFCYDDPETKTRFAFFANEKDPQQGLITISDIFNNSQLIMSDKWTDEQKAAVDKFKALMKDNPDEFNKHACSFFADNLDFRYEAFKSGKLKAPEAKPAEAPAAEEAK